MITIKQRIIATTVFSLFSLTAINANAESIAGQGKCTYKPTVRSYTRVRRRLNVCTFKTTQRFAFFLKYLNIFHHIPEKWLDF